MGVMLVVPDSSWVCVLTFAMKVCEGGGEEGQVVPVVRLHFLDIRDGDGLELLQAPTMPVTPAMPMATLCAGRKTWQVSPCADSPLP